MNISMKTSLNFNDVNLLSDSPSIVGSRSEVTIPPERIIMAPMSSIQSIDIIAAAIKYGISVPIHRFNTPEAQSTLLEKAVKLKQLIESKSELWIAVGMNDYKERIQANKDLLISSKTGVLLDIANGYSYDALAILKEIRKMIGPDLSLFGGNVHTWSGFSFLEEECDIIRCGISNGEACITASQTGIARGQITVIDDIARNIKHAALVSDGGIRNGGDLAKAFGAGADYVMIGGIFKNAQESWCVENNMNFYGGASALAKKSIGLPIKYIEGKAIEVLYENIKPFSHIMDELMEGLKSAVSYSGFDSLESFIGQGRFEINK